MKYGFLFDMDGTMIDNMMVHHRAWQKTLHDLGLPLSLEEVRQSIHGVNSEILARLFGDRFTAAERADIAEGKEAAYRQIFEHQISLIAGLDYFLQTAHNQHIGLAIGTAAPHQNVAFAVKKLQLEQYFSVVVDASHVKKGKPDPEVFLNAAEQLGIAIKDCIVFEDSPTGVAAANNAGCKAIVITTTHTPDEFAAYPNVVCFIKDYTDLKVADVLAYLDELPFPNV